jgi:hypothetical protein
MHFEIHRGLKSGKQLTAAQRSSPTFAEEPVVLGKVLRRGSAPLIVTDSQFEVHKASILRQVLSGSIEVTAVDGGKKFPYSDWVALNTQVELRKEFQTPTVKVELSDAPKVEEKVKAKKEKKPAAPAPVVEEPSEPLDNSEEDLREEA